MLLRDVGASTVSQALPQGRIAQGGSGLMAQRIQMILDGRGHSRPVSPSRTISGRLPHVLPGMACRGPALQIDDAEAFPTKALGSAKTWQAASSASRTASRTRAEEAHAWADTKLRRERAESRQVRALADYGQRKVIFGRRDSACKSASMPFSSGCRRAMASRRSGKAGSEMASDSGGKQGRAFTTRTMRSALTPCCRRTQSAV